MNAPNVFLRSRDRFVCWLTVVFSKRMLALVSFALGALFSHAADQAPSLVAWSGSTLVLTDPQPKSIFVSPIGNDLSGAGSQIKPYASIQKAIDAAAAGDQVVVLAGSYTAAGNGDLRIRGKNVRITAPEGPLKTFVNCGQKMIVTIEAGIGPQVVIRGLTFFNGLKVDSTDWGIAALIGIRGASPVIEDCIFRDNVAEGTYRAGTSYASLIHADGGEPVVRNCLIYRNRIKSGDNAASSSIFSGHFNLIENCTVSGNTLDALMTNWWFFIRKTLIRVFNTDKSTRVLNCISWANQISAIGARSERDPFKTAPEVPEVRYSLLETPVDGVGNISKDPLFSAPAAGNFALLANSPAVDSGDPDSAWESNGTRADMGYRMVGNTSMPIIVRQPLGGTVLMGGSHSFQVVASGAAPLSYQWRRNGTPVVGGSAFLAVTTLAGTRFQSGSEDGTGPTASFGRLESMVADAEGNLFVADSSNHVIRRITRDGTVTTYAGSPGDGATTNGPLASARFNGPQGITLDTSGNLFVSESGGHVIRRISASGSVTTVAGSAGLSGSVNGTGDVARFNLPSGLAVSAGGTLFVADEANHAIRRVTASGSVSIFAGALKVSGSTNGLGGAARFNNPTDLVATSNGTLFVADSGNHVIRRITSSGSVSTFAGSPGQTGLVDGLGSVARFKSPSGLALDSSGNLYVADSGNHVIRRISPTGLVSLYAGMRESDASGGDPGADDGDVLRKARFEDPVDVAVDSKGVVYVSDAANRIIRKIDWDQSQTGKSPVYNVLNAKASDAGDYDVVVSNAGGVATSVKSTLFVVDPKPSIVVQPVGGTADVGGDFTFRVTATGAPVLKYRWRKNGMELPSTSGENSLQSIEGEGYFLVRDAVSGQMKAALQSVFRTDPEGFLVTDQGHRIQGATSPKLTVRYDTKTKSVVIDGPPDKWTVVARALDSGLFSVTLPSVRGVYVGATVTGIGVPEGTVVEEISGNTITLSKKPDITTIAPDVSAELILTKGSPFAVLRDLTQVEAFGAGMNLGAEGLPAGSRIQRVNKARGGGEGAVPILPPVAGGASIIARSGTPYEISWITVSKSDAEKLETGMMLTGNGVGAANGTIAAISPEAFDASLYRLELSGHLWADARGSYSAQSTGKPGAKPSVSGIMVAASHIRFWPQDVSSITSGMRVTGSGIPDGTQVAFVEPVTFVHGKQVNVILSNSLTSDSSGRYEFSSDVVAKVQGVSALPYEVSWIHVSDVDARKLEPGMGVSGPSLPGGYTVKVIEDDPLSPNSKILQLSGHLFAHATGTYTFSSKGTPGSKPGVSGIPVTSSVIRLGLQDATSVHVGMKVTGVAVPEGTRINSMRTVRSFVHGEWVFITLSKALASAEVSGDYAFSYEARKIPVIPSSTLPYAVTEIVFTKEDAEKLEAGMEISESTSGHRGVIKAILQDPADLNRRWVVLDENLSSPATGTYSFKTTGRPGAKPSVSNLRPAASTVRFSPQDSVNLAPGMWVAGSYPNPAQQQKILPEGTTITSLNSGPMDAPTTVRHVTLSNAVLLEGDWEASVYPAIQNGAVRGVLAKGTMGQPLLMVPPYIASKLSPGMRVSSGAGAAGRIITQVRSLSGELTLSGNLSEDALGVYSFDPTLSVDLAAEDTVPGPRVFLEADARVGSKTLRLNDVSNLAIGMQVLQGKGAEGALITALDYFSRTVTLSDSLKAENTLSDWESDEYTFSAAVPAFASDQGIPRLTFHRQVGDLRVGFGAGKDFEVADLNGVTLGGSLRTEALNAMPLARTFSVSSNGQVRVHLTDGTSFVAGNVFLRTFEEPQQLVPESQGLFSGLDAATPSNGAFRADNLENLTPGGARVGSLVNGGSPICYLPKISESDVGDYDVVVSNAHGSATSNKATLGVRFPIPKILVQPLGSGTMSVGDSARLSARVVGAGGLTYQWFKDGLPLPGTAAGGTLDLGPMQPWLIGDYTLKVTNETGSVTSQSAFLGMASENTAIWKNLEAYYLMDGDAKDTSPFQIHGTAREGAYYTLDRRKSVKAATDSLSPGASKYAIVSGVFGSFAAAKADAEARGGHLATVTSAEEWGEIKKQIGTSRSGPVFLGAYKDAVSSYKVIQGAFTWAQAKSDAEAKGGHLVTISSESEWKEMVSQLGVAVSKGRTYWAGGYQEAVSAEPAGGWKWVTGEPFNFTRWWQQEPNNNGPEDSLQIYGDWDSLTGGRWNDLSGRRTLPGYILEIEGSGEWKWVTGEPFTFSNWRSGEPNNFDGSERFLEVYSDWTWNDLGEKWFKGNGPQGYVIEFDAVSNPLVTRTEPLEKGNALGVSGESPVFSTILDGVGMPVHDLVSQIDCGNKLGVDLLVLPQSKPVSLWRRTGAFSFSDVSAQVDLPGDLIGRNVMVGDMDNNGFQDLVVWSERGLEVFLYDGSRFVKPSEASSVLSNPGLPESTINLFKTAWSSRVISNLADIDGDGALDVVFSHREFDGSQRGRVRVLYNQNSVDPKNGRRIWSQSSHGFSQPAVDVITTTWKYPFFCVFDANGDQHPDIVMVESDTEGFQSYPGRVFLNTGPWGTFVEVADCGISDATAMSTFHAVDLDGDGNMDLINGSSDWSSVSVPHIYYGKGNGRFETTVSPFKDAYYHHGSLSADFDLDGKQDVMWSHLHNYSNTRARIWQNLGGRSYVEKSEQWGMRMQGVAGNLGFGAYAADLNGDGALDLVAGDNWAKFYDIYRNNSAVKGASRLQIVPVGVLSPADGSGVRMEVTAAGQRMVQDIGAPYRETGFRNTQFFGLGSATVADKITVRWPSGRVDEFLNVPANQRIVVVEGDNVLKGHLGSLASSVGGVALPDSELLLKARTFSLWAKFDSLDAGGRLLFRGDTQEGGDPIDLHLGENGILVLRSATSGITEAKAPESVKTGLWYHLAGTVNDTGGVLSLYINGQKVDEKRGIPSIEIPLNAGLDSGWGIGNHSGVTQTTFNLPFKGSIDDVRFYNRVLTPSEIGELYMSEASINAPLILTQPIAGTVGLSGKYTFSVAAVGKGLKYQWRRNGVNIPGANGADLSFDSIAVSDGGSYDVLVSNGFGVAYSQAVLLTISGTPPPVGPALGGNAVYVTKQGNDLTGDGSIERPYLTISKAVTSVPSGAMILVGAGTYAERFEYVGKTLRIYSIAGAQATTIQGAAGRSSVVMDGPGSELRGFRFTGGTGDLRMSGGKQERHGGAVICTANGVISDCVFVANGKGTSDVLSATYGGAISVVGNGVHLSLVNSLFSGNYARGAGAGNSWDGGGSAVFVQGGNVDVDRCTFFGNGSPTENLGVQLTLGAADGGQISLRNSIAFGNAGLPFGAIMGRVSEVAVNVEYSNVQGVQGSFSPGGAPVFTKGLGNITTDPQFVDPPKQNFALKAGSPAINAASPQAPLDVDGSRADMGWRADRYGFDTVLYVATTGNDASGTGSMTNPYRTISKAVSIAPAGSRIMVGPGVYPERVDLGGKMLRLHSQFGPDFTTIQGGTGGAVVTIEKGAANSELRGFKIVGGQGKLVPDILGDDWRLNVYSVSEALVRDTKPLGDPELLSTPNSGQLMIRDETVFDEVALGGGIYCGTSAFISDCVLTGNGASRVVSESASRGGAIYVEGGRVSISNCLIYNNFARLAGGAIFVQNGSIDLDRCTVHGNSVAEGIGLHPGISVANTGKLDVRNSIVWGHPNTPIGIHPGSDALNAEVFIEYSDIQGNTDLTGAAVSRDGFGNITSDPLFLNAEQGNFTLAQGSAARDAASPSLPFDEDGTLSDMGWRIGRYSNGLEVYVSKTGNDTTGTGSFLAPYLTVGRAVAMAPSGAWILVGPGTYAERVEIRAKSVGIRSLAGPRNTTLQGVAGNTVVFIDRDAGGTRIHGFRITGGTGRPLPSAAGNDFFGGGVFSIASATLADCILDGNGKGATRQAAATFGGAVYSGGGRMNLVNCLLSGNLAWVAGGAIFTENGTIELDRCTVTANDAKGVVGQQGGVAVAAGGKILVKNSIVFGNTGVQVGLSGGASNLGTSLGIEYSDIQGGAAANGLGEFIPGPGNIGLDPKFAAQNIDFVLQSGSPAMDAADPLAPRDQDGSRADMGWRLDRYVIGGRGYGKPVLSLNPATFPRAGVKALMRWDSNTLLVSGSVSHTGQVDRVVFESTVSGVKTEQTLDVSEVAPVYIGERAVRNWLWSLELPMETPGQVQYSAYAVDRSNIRSEVVAGSFSVVRGCPVQVVLPDSSMGTVTVTPAIPESGLVEEGTRLQISASARPGYLLRLLEVTVNGVPEEDISKTTANVLVNGDTVITPQFIPNPFPRLAGRWTGVMNDSRVGGNISLTVDSLGSYSIKIQVGRNSFSYAGKMDASGLTKIPIPVGFTPYAQFNKSPSWSSSASPSYAYLRIGNGITFDFWNEEEGDGATSLPLVKAASASDIAQLASRRFNLALNADLARAQEEITLFRLSHSESQMSYLRLVTKDSLSFVRGRSYTISAVFPKSFELLPGDIFETFPGPMPVEPSKGFLSRIEGDHKVVEMTYTMTADYSGRPSLSFYRPARSVVEVGRVRVVDNTTGQLLTSNVYAGDAAVSQWESIPSVESEKTRNALILTSDPWTLASDVGFSAADVSPSGTVLVSGMMNVSEGDPGQYVTFFRLSRDPNVDTGYIRLWYKKPVSLKAGHSYKVSALFPKSHEVVNGDGFEVWQAPVVVSEVAQRSVGEYKVIETSFRALSDYTERLDLAFFRQLNEVVEVGKVVLTNLTTGEVLTPEVYHGPEAIDQWEVDSILTQKTRDEFVSTPRKTVRFTASGVLGMQQTVDENTGQSLTLPGVNFYAVGTPTEIVVAGSYVFSGSVASGLVLTSAVWTGALDPGKVQVTQDDPYEKSFFADGLAYLAPRTGQIPVPFLDLGKLVYTASVNDALLGSLSWLNGRALFRFAPPASASAFIRSANMNFSPSSGAFSGNVSVLRSGSGAPVLRTFSGVMIRQGGNGSWTYQPAGLGLSADGMVITFD
jgi:sugar lactone lactonase YvrE